MSIHVLPAVAGTSRRSGLATIAACTVALVLVSGCAERRHSITVGAIPDDYRTNHPIVVAEKEETVDLPISRDSRGLSADQRSAVLGFMAGYDRRSGGAVHILVPSGSANEVAAMDAAHEAVRLLAEDGVPRNRIALLSYAAGAGEANAPIRLSYTALRASAGPCGRWPEDLLHNAQNRHYANFGCSYQNNLAAQIANPADLLTPRKPAEIDPENRQNAIEDYKTRAVSEEFFDKSEIFY
jgi:pilus assembly protein CpaD